jgi:succinate dehydrogenase / fumarate reductase iron-sulfur subunit
VTKTINLTLKVWRQNGSKDKGRFDTYHAENISTDMSFLEMLDVVNDQLTIDDKEPIAFDHDCREGICGMCGCVVNGRAHGAEKGTTLCQLHMRHFDNGDTIAIEPFRAMAFKVIKDLAVDRSALDKIIQAGGYVSVNTGGAQDANAILVPQEVADLAMDAAQCIGCGACVASCPNASAMLFTSAKISQLALLPQGKPEAAKRALNMVRAMDALGFGNCTNERECEAECPKEISITNIARLNREFIKATEKQTLRIRAKVVYLDDKGIGCRFVDLGPSHQEMLERCFNVFNATLPID